MVYALLFDKHDQLLAAAPAATQTAIGETYWTEIYAQNVKFDSDCQTAYVEIDNAELVELLDSLEYSDEHLQACRQRISELSAIAGNTVDSTTQPKAA